MQKPVNGALSPKATKTTSDEDKPLVRTKHLQPAKEVAQVEARDESTQAGHVEAADKAVQSEQPKTVDEGIQVDETKEKGIPAKAPSKDQGALPPLPVVGDDASTTSIVSRHFLSSFDSIFALICGHFFFNSVFFIPCA